MITKTHFGVLDTNEDVYYYTMKNKAGMSVKICQFGGAIMELRVPDRYGRMGDVVCGYDSLRDYVLAAGYVGALVGRTCNHIAKGKYRIDGKEYSAYCNNNGNSLHGGKVGFSHRLWNVKAEDGDEPRLILTLHSPDGEEGYPGNLDVTVTYTLTSTNALSIHYEATTDQKTVVNLTNHAYFNLGGYASGKIFDHGLQIDADRFIVTDDKLIPTGEIRSVEGTPFDFRHPKAIGLDFEADDECLKIAGGYDHCFNFVGGETAEPVKRAELYDSASGRLMEVYTNQPCVQFYSGNFLTNAEFPFKGGYKQVPQTLLCLETQKMPDSVNHDNFTNCVLKPGEKYDFTTEYRFSVK